MVDTEFFVDVANGLVPGRTNFTIFGFAPSVTSVQLPITVWDAGIAYSLPSAVESWEISSSSTDDSASGIGARTVVLQPLLYGHVKSNPVLVTMNGQNWVSIPGQYCANNLLAVAVAGSNKTNVGNITLRSTPAGLTRGYIAAGKSVERRAMYTVPAGHSAWLGNFSLANARSGGAEATLHEVPYIWSEYGALRSTALEVTLLRGLSHFGVPAGFAVPEKTTVEYRITAVSADGFNASFGATGILTDLTHPAITIAANRQYPNYVNMVQRGTPLI